MTADTEPTAALLLDEQLPAYETRQFTAVVVEASPERTYAAVRALDPDQVARSFPLMVVLGQLRALPARLRRQPPAPEALSADEATEAFVLGEEPGRVRRYWLVVGPFAGLIMRRWLRLAKHDAEQAATR